MCSFTKHIYKELLDGKKKKSETISCCPLPRSGGSQLKPTCSSTQSDTQTQAGGENTSVRSTESASKWRDEGRTHPHHLKSARKDKHQLSRRLMALAHSRTRTAETDRIQLNGTWDWTIHWFTTTTSNEYSSYISLYSFKQAKSGWKKTTVEIHLPRE